MLRCLLQACAAALLAVAACTPSERQPGGDGRGGEGPARGDSGQFATTPQIEEGLSRDLQAAERDLAATEDSIYVFLGDPLAAELRVVGARWKEYRQLQCDAIRSVFAPGTMAPVGQMDCLVVLTDDRRRFLGEQYSFMRPARVPGRDTVR